ncbi:Branched-chain amino acid transport system / permease component [Roseovarius lutimaris]|uniref:Branched-chain amino acid transport system / permease component n=2 Tax=Roseovarius lutimaris TaxID=1005928 RepID=A0A1I4ZFE9_9RHOB|nr:Branched-chain amino acid transport system / permease component [Roseovarius lutimaris]
MMIEGLNLEFFDHEQVVIPTNLNRVFNIGGVSIPELRLYVILAAAMLFVAMTLFVEDQDRPGYRSLRVKGHYFTIVTLAFNMVIFIVLMNFHDLAQGEAGITGIPKPGSKDGLFNFRDRETYCYMVLIIATLMTGLAALIVRSRIGQTLVATRQNEGLVGAIGIALRLCQIAPRDLRDRYLPALLSGQVSACTALTEPGTGSDFAAATTTARQDGDGWRLNGEKTWIINGRHTGLSIVYAQYAAPGGFTFNDVALPTQAKLIAPGTAFKAILTEINAARTYVAAMCNGMMSAAIETVQSYGATRHSFGKPLNAIPSWQAHLADAVAAPDASTAVTAKAVALVTNAEDAQLAAAEAKIVAVTAAQTHLPQVLQLMGAEGLRPEHPFTRRRMPCAKPCWPIAAKHSRP